jgi:hypothetical protein
MEFKLFPTKVSTMIKKSEITHGAIFAIPLWNVSGYLYGKMLFGSHLKNQFVRKRDVFIRVYDYYTAELVTDFPEHFFEARDLFVDPFILMGFPKVRGAYSWRFLRHDSLFDEDEFIHHYWNPGMLGDLNISDKDIFRVVKYGNLRNTDDCYFPYYRIKHLPIFRDRNSDFIGLYLTYDWLKRRGENVDDYFEYHDGMDFKKTVRLEVMHYAMDYRKIPKELRGRVAPEDPTRVGVLHQKTR